MFKRTEGVEILQSTRVLDGTGKKQLDENDDEVQAILYADP